MRQAFLPVGWYQIGLLVQGVHVPCQGQGDHVSLQAIDDRTSLFARAAMRLLDDHVLSRGGFPMLGECGVELDIQLPCGVVRDIQ